ncbi:MAG: flagellar assembly protein FliH [Microbacteriaceae bacterium]|nr:flagellar assembly protein FliH [Microbacteriaceae bacterium]
MSTSSFAPLAFPELETRRSEEFAERARVHGHAAGYAAGRRDAAAALERDRIALRADMDRALAAETADLRVASAALQRAAAALTERATSAFAATEEDLLAAAVELATMILGRELEDREGSAVAAVRRALDAAAGAPVRVLRMHALDVELLADRTPEVPGLRLLPDSGLARGDAVAELEDGIVDAGIAAALERVRIELAGGEQ